MPRPIYAIAQDIRKAWPKPNFAAKPYLDAMFSLEKKTDRYGADDAASIILYFLSNASSFRGEDARKLKEELKNILA